jgi:NADP-dependent aldehyde dehydrogenase
VRSVPSQSVDPRTGEGFGPVFDDTSRVELAAVLALAASAARPWAQTSGAVRAALLRRVADALDTDAEALVDLADRETALGHVRLTGELARTTFQLRMFADLVGSGRQSGTRVDPEVAGPPPAGHPELRLVRVALGPVAVFGASNFPFAFSVPGGDTASALAAGCPVVVKAHPAHPQTSQRCGEIVAGALAAGGAPAGVFAVVHGFAVGQRMVTDPRIRAAAFTGSGAGGRALFDAAVGRPDPIPFYGELGSVNPVVITPSAAAEPSDLVAGWLGSLTLGGGQFCTNPGLVLAPLDSTVAEEIRRQAAELPEAVLLHTGVASHLDASLAAVLSSPGAEVVACGPSGDDAGVRRPVTVVAVPAESALEHPDLLATECFGPVGVVVEYSDRDQLLALLDVLPGCLVGTVHSTDDDPLAADVIAAVTRIAGRVVWNGWPTGVAVTAGQHHGGPWPATTNPLHTSVGTAAIDRFTRPVAFQSVPDVLLPEPFTG